MIGVGFKAFAVFCFAIIYLVEEVVSRYTPSYDHFVDVGFYLFTPLHQMIKGPEWYSFRVVMFGIQTLVIGGVLLFILARILVYDRFHVGKQTIVMYTLRIVAMLSFVLPNDPDVIWHFPGIPATLNDYFFSGHVAVSIIAGAELSAMGYTKLGQLLSVYFNIYQGVVFLVTHSHYSVDIIAGVFCGIMITYVFSVPEKRKAL
jgi:hypothetical protein